MGVASTGNELGHDPLDGSHGNRETDPRRGAARADDCGVDADHPSFEVEERPAGVAGIDGGVGLDNLSDEPPVRAFDDAPE
jgi:hypothetical protein